MDRTPAGVFFMWPFAVALESGRYRRTASAVRPGHDANWLLLIAMIHVDGSGLNAHWWRNWINFNLEEVWYALWEAWVAKVDGGFEEMLRSFVGTTQRPVAG